MIEAKLRKLATDCRDCRAGFCCGKCLCCLPEDKLRALVEKAQESTGAESKSTKNGRK